MKIRNKRRASANASTMSDLGHHESWLGVCVLSTNAPKNHCMDEYYIADDIAQSNFPPRRESALIYAKALW